MATDARDDLAVLIEQIATMDSFRVAQLRLASTASEAERMSLEAEAKRLAAKHGPESAQALEAPATKEGQFVVYGRVLDSTGAALRGAKLAAIGPNGSSLASTSSNDSGAYELQVPVKEANVTFQIQLVARTGNITFPETFNAVPQRLALRDLVMPAAAAPAESPKNRTAMKDEGKTEAAERIKRRVGKTPKKS
jgi:hypothetical protein